MTGKTEENTETKTKIDKPFKPDYAKWTFGLLLWLCAVTFFGSVLFISLITNFNIDTNADYVMQGILWMVWTHFVPLIALGMLMIFGITRFIDLLDLRGVSDD